MTLGRLLLAWLPVAVWFAVTTGLTRHLTKSAAPWSAAFRACAEALVVTLLASLWFDSLGAGVFWLPATLLGILVAIAGAFPVLPAPRSRNTIILLVLTDVVRYLIAGVLLVWRLG